MHSIDNGYSIERKRDNWRQIASYLNQINEPNLRKLEIEPLITNENDEILLFIIKLYGELTKNRLSVLDVKKIRTDTDDINKSYLLKDTGEVELIKKDSEIEDKHIEDMQRSVSKYLI